MASNGTDTKADDELTQLKALVAEQQERLDALEGHSDASANGGDGREQKATRRELLKLAGAALAGAAGTAALRAIPASANFGDTMTVGTVFVEQVANATGIKNTTAYPGANTAVYGYSFNSGFGVLAKSYYGIASYAHGVYGGGGPNSNTRPYGTGLVASGGHNGVVGTAGNAYGTNFTGTGVTGVGTGVGGVGVLAQTNSTGSKALFAYTSATNSFGAVIDSVSSAGLFVTGGGGYGTFSQSPVEGIVGVSYGGYSGVAAGSIGGPDLKAFGTGRLVQFHNLSGGVGAPNFSPAVNYFEMVRAGDGAMWISGANTTGTSRSRWRRVNAVRVDSSDGLGSPFKPFRAKDTRSGGGAKRPANSMTVVPIAGLGTLTSNIPADAVAIIGNLTATGYSGGGFMAIMPAGIVKGTGAGQYNPLKDPSSLNFITGQGAIANGFVVGLGTTGTNKGKVQVWVGGSASHFIIDVTGYLQ